LDTEGAVVGVTRLAILGSTGSIGTSALDVVRAMGRRVEVVGLSAARSVEALAEQVAEFGPAVAALADREGAERLKALLPGGCHTKVVWGPQGYEEVAAGCGADVVLSAMVGSAGMLPTLAAAKAGVRLALANKESLVAAGGIITEAVKAAGGRIIPVDSEHSAIFQALRAGRRRDVRRLVLTASGGPFKDLSPQELERVSPSQAVAHPTWQMGPKISVDSATMMNKGLEVIEAMWLFRMSPDRIEVLIHPQSVIHSLVEFVDGSLMAQLGPTDMRLPIAYALSYPARVGLGLRPLELAEVGTLEFRRPDFERFPALELAYQAARTGMSAPAVLSEANEEAVEAFLAGRIGFTQITQCVEAVLAAHQPWAVDELGAVVEAQRWARARAREWIQAHGRNR